MVSYSSEVLGHPDVVAAQAKLLEANQRIEAHRENYRGLIRATVEQLREVDPHRHPSHYEGDAMAAHQRYGNMLDRAREDAAQAAWTAKERVKLAIEQQRANEVRELEERRARDADIALGVAVASLSRAA